MTNNKLVIRRLPPSMSEDDFLRQVAPLPDHNYFCFFEANPNLGSYSFSRAYINFLDANSTVNFLERFDNYIFLDKDGHEYPAVVEPSFWQKTPRDGPFCGVSARNGPSNHISVVSKSNGQAEGGEEDESVASIGIEQDSDFLEFMEKHRNSKKRNQQSPSQTLETNLDELTKQSVSGSIGKKNSNNKVITPLIGYVNQKRVMRNNRRGKK